MVVVVIVVVMVAVVAVTATAVSTAVAPRARRRVVRRRPAGPVHRRQPPREFPTIGATHGQDEHYLYQQETQRRQSKWLESRSY